LWEGSGRVKFYRVYHIDAKGGTTGLTNFTTSNDDLACEQARAILARSKWPGIEVWELGRQVHCGGIALSSTGPPDFPPQKIRIVN
jgi:hypothetical protein